MLKFRKVFLALCIFALPSVSGVRAQTVDEIIKKHVDAVGGQDAWNKVTSMRAQGAVTVQGTDIEMTICHVLNKGFRMDMTMMGMSGYQILTPTAGWSYFPMNGQKQAEAMTADQVKESQDELDVMDPFIHYKERGTAVEFVGKEDVDGTECFKIRMTPKSGKIVTAFIDPSSYYLIRETEKAKANGQERESSTDFSNFQKLPEGVTVPMMIGSPMGGLTLKKVEINPKLDDSLFQKS